MTMAGPRVTGTCRDPVGAASRPPRALGRYRHPCHSVATLPESLHLPDRPSSVPERRRRQGDREAFLLLSPIGLPAGPQPLTASPRWHRGHRVTAVLLLRAHSRGRRASHVAWSAGVVTARSHCSLPGTPGGPVAHTQPFFSVKGSGARALPLCLSVVGERQPEALAPGGPRVPLPTLCGPSPSL